MSGIESALMAALNGTLEPELRAWMTEVGLLEASLNQTIPVFGYEGGPALSISSGSLPWWNAFNATQEDPGMYSVVMNYLDDLNAAGFQGVCYSNLAGTPTTVGEYGSIEYLGQPSNQTPKYNALVAFPNSPKLAITGLGTTGNAGAPATFTVTVYNPNGDGIDTGYVGTVQFSSTDPQAVLPPSYTFTAADGGIHTFTETLKTSGLQTLAVTDSTTGVDGQSAVAVSPVAAQTLAFAYPSSVYVGVPSSFTVTLYDQYGNVATGYTGTIQFTSSDPNATLPSNYTFRSTDAGVHSFTSTLEGFGADNHRRRFYDAGTRVRRQHSREHSCRLGYT